MLLTIAIVLLAVFLYAQLVRFTSMFIPSKYPVGNWSESAYAIHPQNVEFTASDSVRLHGWFFRAGQPTMVWFHGNAGNITDRAPVAAELARRGISVLLFDWRGYGRSDGWPSEWGLYRDAIAAYDFARANTAGDLTAYGESLGGPYAAYAAAHRNVRCVIIENSMPSLASLANALYRPFPMGVFVPFALRTEHWLNKAGVPVLVMHSKVDAVIPFAVGKELYDGLRVPKEMLVSETAAHCEIPIAEPQRYYDAVMRVAAGALALRQ